MADRPALDLHRPPCDNEHGQERVTLMPRQQVQPDPLVGLRQTVLSALQDIDLEDEDVQDWQHPFLIGRRIQRVIAEQGFNPYEFNPEDFESAISAAFDADMFVLVLDVWPRIRQPEGETSLSAAAKQIATTTWRVKVPDVFPDAPKERARLLATHLWCLTAGGATSCFMSVRSAAAILQCHFRTAAAILRLLVRYRVIQLVHEADKPKRHAREYQFPK